MILALGYSQMTEKKRKEHTVNYKNSLMASDSIILASPAKKENP
jgi:hypothetical protein